MTDSKNEIRYNRKRNYLIKDYEGFRIAFTQYAKTFFSPEKINDLSETGLGGMFVDLAAYVGDNLSFYLDHQFGEMDPESAVETSNIEKHLRNAGVKITGAAPAVTNLTIAFELDAEQVGNTYVPKRSQIPAVLAGSKFQANNGITFELTDTVDFNHRKPNGELTAAITLSESTPAGLPRKFIITREGTAVSGTRTIDTFSISSQYKAFRRIALSNENVTAIMSVRDSEGNTYHEVEALTHDTVFRKVINNLSDNNYVTDSLELIAAPHRFVSQTSLDGRITSLQFGAGDATSSDIDGIPDAVDLTLPLYGKQTFPRYSIDPTALLRTQTLGIAPQGTTLTVDYRYGGGLNHNAPAGSIRNLVDIRLQFPNGPTAVDASRVRSSLGVTNREAAVGGDSSPTVNELKSRIAAYRNAQSRVVTAPDLLARVYTLPASFGRVFRAGVRSNPNNPLATQLHVISRDIDGKLITTPDSLKLNMRQYLNPFRMISDAVDILDSAIINFGIEYQVVISPTDNHSLVMQTINQRLQKFVDIRNRQIDQPISLSDIRNLIYNNTGVMSVVDIKIRNISGQNGKYVYSDVQYDINANTLKDHIFPPGGGILELRYPLIDIVGSAV